MTVDASSLAVPLRLTHTQSASVAHFIEARLGDGGRAFNLAFLLTDEISSGTRREIAKSDITPVWVHSVVGLGLEEPTHFDEKSARELLTHSTLNLDPLAEAVLVPRICSHMDGFMKAGSGLLSVCAMLHGYDSWRAQPTIRKITKLCSTWSRAI